LVLAYLFVPGWESVARVLQLDKVPPERFRIFFVIALPVFAVLAIEYTERAATKRSWILGTVSGAIAALAILGIAVRLFTLDPATLGISPTWIFASVVLVAATVLVFIRGLAPLAAVCLLVGTVVSAGLVNPLYRGIYDLRDTKIGEAILQVDEHDSGTWVAVGAPEVMAVLMETGVESLSGVQTYPPTELWKEVDPSGQYENVWNRLAHISWQFEPGEPVLTNPRPDVIAATLDPCSTFAQHDLSYVLSDTKSTSSCLAVIDEVRQGHQQLYIYDVIPPRR
jgi:hypothetical protein